jgi:hypothetical protein
MIRLGGVSGGEHGNHAGSSCLSLVLITVLFPAGQFPKGIPALSALNVHCH